MNQTTDIDALARDIKIHGESLGFQQIGIAGVALDQAERYLERWLQNGNHGEMAYMQRHGKMRSQPAELLPGTLRVITARMDYLPQGSDKMAALLEQPGIAYVARYALGRDYHKVLRKRLTQLAKWINEQSPHRFRAFVDSAPVMEKPLAQNAGLGWIGKHTNLINSKAGSWFFLGEIYTDLPLPVDAPEIDHCGTCSTCMEVCPTQAIIGPYELDARRCISYLTIELKGRIPVELRSLIGNRIYGCDDCQLFCPWNKFAELSAESDFAPRHRLEQASLVELFNWSEQDFLTNTEGSPIRRTGYIGWLRNIAVGLGNGPSTPEAIAALKNRQLHASDIVREHVAWALEQLNTLDEVGLAPESPE